MKAPRNLREKIAVSERLIRRYEDRACVVAFSGGKDSSVLAHLVHSVVSDVPLLFLDHGAHFQETLDLVETLKNVLRITTKEAWKPDTDACCGLIKIGLLNEGIARHQISHLFVGIRRDEHESRDVPQVEEKDGHQRVYPILDWSENEVWQYLVYYNVPVNPLYAQGYRSLACVHCSTPNVSSERGGMGEKERILYRLRSMGYF